MYRTHVVVSTNEHTYDSRPYYWTKEQLDEENFTLGRFNNSMNFIFGLSGGNMGDPTFDILNNPYIDYNAYERTGGRTFYPKYELEKCSN